ncbi:MAG: hypothetical protein CM15mP77_2020 [Synechococcus sp.]|nr:MAG: hypothetical protein CM15mP77_2020 [Synechococcus sp.]
MWSNSLIRPLIWIVPLREPPITADPLVLLEPPSSLDPELEATRQDLDDDGLSPLHRRCRCRRIFHHRWCWNPQPRGASDAGS